MTGPIRFAGHLPPGALLAGALLAGRALRPAVTTPAISAGGPAPIWLDKDHGIDGSRVRHWQARPPTDAAAGAIAANPAGTARSGMGALVFAARQNGGLCLPGAVPDAASTAFAAIFAPEPGQSAGTVLSLHPTDGSGYLFVAQDDGQVRIGHRDGLVSLALPAPEGVLLVHVMLAQGRVGLSVNGGTMQTAAFALNGAADLFIGCRDNRGGLRNKLGAFRLSDVLLWPDGPAPDAAEAGAGALALWQERQRDGI